VAVRNGQSREANDVYAITADMLHIDKSICSIVFDFYLPE